MKIAYRYGKEEKVLEVPFPQTEVIRPRHLPGLEDEAAAFREAVRNPVAGASLQRRLRKDSRVAIVIPDITRPLPSDRVLPWILEELAGIPPEYIVIVNGTGSHRPNTKSELREMVGDAVFDRVRVVNHDASDTGGLASAGRTSSGRNLCFRKEVLEADLRILLGFIEPHFVAGFSGGYKAVMPGTADMDSILEYHGAKIIGSPCSTWGRLDDNPTQQCVREWGAMAGPSFLINLTLNNHREITRWFCGDVVPAHDAGCEFVRQSAMAGFEQPFDLVITTNAGHPLDQNLYQTVKGISAGFQIVREGGQILCLSRCGEGFPEHGNFRRLLFEGESPRAILDRIEAPGFSMYDQWEAQLLAMIQVRARVALHSEIPAEEVRRAHLEPVADPESWLRDKFRELGAGARVAVLPEGPMSIPYLSGAAGKSRR